MPVNNSQSDNHTNGMGWFFLTVELKEDFDFVETYFESTTSDMYLVITTAIWMNKSNDQRSKNARNVPFGVFGVMLPYRIVRSTHFSDLCV